MVAKGEFTKRLFECMLSVLSDVITLDEFYYIVANEMVEFYFTVAKEDAFAGAKLDPLANNMMCIYLGCVLCHSNYSHNHHDLNRFKAEIKEIVERVGVKYEEKSNEYKYS